MKTTAETWDEFRAQRPELPPARLMNSFHHERTLQVAREFGHVDAQRFADCLWYAFCHGKGLEVYV